MGWFEYDPLTRELESSAELARMLDRQPPEGPRTVDAVVELVHPDDRARVRAGLEHAEEHGTAGVEARLVTGDGKTLWAEMSALRTLVGEGRSEVVGVLRDVSERKAAEAEQLRMARTDALTGLPNRAGLAERARQALGAGERFSLVLMDLDSFKDVNDTLGHQVGDQVLVAVAARLAAHLREGDVLARLGGDEFAIVVPEAGVKAMELAQRLLGTLHGPVEVDGVAVTVREVPGWSACQGTAPTSAPCCAGPSRPCTRPRAETAASRATPATTRERRGASSSLASSPPPWPGPRCRCTTSPPSS